MAKIKTVGDREKLLERKKELNEQETFISAIANLKEKELEQWFDHHFSSLSKEVREGLEVMAKALWANVRVTGSQWKTK